MKQNKEVNKDLIVMSEWSFSNVGEDPLIKNWSENINEKTNRKVF